MSWQITWKMVGHRLSLPKAKFAMPSGNLFLISKTFAAVFRAPRRARATVRTLAYNLVFRLIYLRKGLFMNVFDFQATGLDGQPVDLATYRGRVLLVVNTASRCGFTPQYAGLEALYRDLHASGLEVLGFPCNQFGAQEPGSAAEIGAFCDTHYGVSFPLFAKVDVNGEGAHPLWTYLKEAAPGVLGTELIKWNFTKFLVGRDGRVVKRYAPATKPEDIADDIRALLAA
jgi:glutathione peroxidase